MAAQLRDLPLHVRQEVAAHAMILDVTARSRRVSLKRDILELMDRPAARAFLVSGTPETGLVRWAAIASAFVAEVRDKAPDLLGEYVLDLLPCVALVVRPMANLFRMGPNNELRRATQDQRLKHLRLSMLGPLALFFLESVARASFVWDVLVEREMAPARPMCFGWAPALDSLPAAMRLALLCQVGRRLRHKALLGSPLARYLMEMGLVHVLTVQKSTPCHSNDRWLLSSECASRTCASGPRAVMLSDSWDDSPSWEAEDTIVDRRTGRYSQSPQDEAELLEARLSLLAAARSLVGRYASSPRRQVKRLALWAHVADVEPATLLAPPELLDEDVLAALAQAAVQQRQRQTCLTQLNATLGDPMFSDGASETTAFTSGQCRTHLTRLRQEFQCELVGGM